MQNIRWSIWKGIDFEVRLFSSTLDANCEDKEASLYASTAAYYLALATKGAERAHYAGLARKAAYLHCHGTIHGMSLLPPVRCWVI